MSASLPQVTMLTASLQRTSGGVFPVLSAAAERLWSLGWPVQVVGFGAPETPDPRLTQVPIIGRATLGYAPGLARALARSSADLTHLHGLWTQPSMAVLAWARRTGRPRVISPHGMLDPWALARSPWKKKRLAAALFERANLDSADCLHALTAAEARAMRGFGLKNPIAVIPNGVDLPPLGARPQTERKELLFLGRLHPKKGLAETLHAWSHLSHVAPQIRREWRLVIAGWDDGGHQARLERLVADLGMTRDVTFRGPLFGAAKDRALRQASAFVLASHSEGLPMAVLEAWSHGVAVFMTPECHLSEGFARGAAIRIRTDPNAMARSFAAHLGRSDLDLIGARGRALVADRFAWDQIAQRYAALYEWLGGSGPRPALWHAI